MYVFFNLRAQLLMDEIPLLKCLPAFGDTKQIITVVAFTGVTHTQPSTVDQARLFVLVKQTL